jgi:single-stranded DNA-binding protein
MSVYAMATGVLIAAPQQREGAKGQFATGTLRTTNDGADAVLVSIIAFGDQSEQLLRLARGNALSVSGRARLTTWVGRDGAEKHGLSIVGEQIACLKPARKPPRSLRPGARSTPHSSRNSGLTPAADDAGGLWESAMP